jgi:hypothetical protein
VFQPTRRLKLLPVKKGFANDFVGLGRGFAMDVIVQGVVRDGHVIPDTPLPEGARVEVRLGGPPPDVPSDLQAEFDAWGRASDRALELIDGLEPEGGADAAR